MSLRSGFSNFLNNAKQWGLRTGTNIRNFYTQAREVAHRVQPHLQKTTRFVEGVNRHAQVALTDPRHREVSDTWTRKLRKLSDEYDLLLNKADRIHDIVVE